MDEWGAKWSYQVLIVRREKLLEKRGLRSSDGFDNELTPRSEVEERPRGATVGELLHHDIVDVCCGCFLVLCKIRRSNVLLGFLRRQMKVDLKYKALS